MCKFYAIYSQHRPKHIELTKSMLCLQVISMVVLTRIFCMHVNFNIFNLGRIYTYTVRASVLESVSESLTEFCLHYIRSSDPRSSEAPAILVACSSDYVNRRLWASMRIARTRTSASEEIATGSDELGHGRPRQKSRTQAQTSVNTKHQFTCFDCVRARTRMFGLRSRM